MNLMNIINNGKIKYSLMTFKKYRKVFFYLETSLIVNIRKNLSDKSSFAHLVIYSNLLETNFEH